MTEQKKLTSAKLDHLFHDTVDLISRHGCFTGSTLAEENGNQSIELTALSLDDEDLEVVATVYIKGDRLRELQGGEEQCT